MSPLYKSVASELNRMTVLSFIKIIFSNLKSNIFDWPIIQARFISVGAMFLIGFQFILHSFSTCIIAKCTARGGTITVQAAKYEKTLFLPNCKLLK